MSGCSQMPATQHNFCVVHAVVFNIILNFQKYVVIVESIAVSIFLLCDEALIGSLQGPHGMLQHESLFCSNVAGNIRKTMPHCCWKHSSWIPFSRRSGSITITMSRAPTRIIGFIHLVCTSVCVCQSRHVLASPSSTGLALVQL